MAKIPLMFYHIFGEKRCSPKVRLRIGKLTPDELSMSLLNNGKSLIAQSVKNLPAVQETRV